MADVKPWETFEYNNEEEAEMAQIHSLHISMNALADVQRRLAKQREQTTQTDCVDCGEAIPLARQQLVPGVQRCVFCQELAERR